MLKTRLVKRWYILLIVLAGCQASEEEQISVNDISWLQADRFNVGFLIMDGVYNTELTAPYDIFHHTIFRDSIKAMNVFTMSNSWDPIVSFEGLTITPNFNYLSSNMPKIDILVVPSAAHHLDSDLLDTAMLGFVKRTAEHAMYVASHCDGAFVLAKAGVLDGRASTTFPGDIATYREMFPGLDIVDRVVFVHDGKFITSAGGAKSFEASLYLIEKLYGKNIADQIAEGLVIDWDLEQVRKHIRPDSLDKL